jgi:CRP-like cAMP-binding protein
MSALLNPDDDPEQSRDSLRAAALFAGLSDEELACFHRAAQARSYPKDKILFLQEDPAEFFYVVLGGWVKRRKRSATEHPFENSEGANTP